MRKAAIRFLSIVVIAAATAAQAGPAAQATLADFEDLGLGARWTLPFPITGSSVAVGGTYFFDGEYVALDGDLHLKLSGAGLASFYPLGGLQLATDFDDSDLNVNLGAGFNFSFSGLGAFVEGKFVLGDADYFAATVGLQF